jgi:hypothetical protein
VTKGIGLLGLAYGLFAASGCGWGSIPALDAGPSDGGSVEDSGATDSGADGGALTDSGSSDAGFDGGEDSGSSDAGFDGGEDSGSSDGGFDGGSGDGGSLGAKPLFIATTVLPIGQQGLPYDAWLIAGAGATPYKWSLTSGSFPSGVTLSADGTLSGTPGSAGVFSVDVLVEDSSSPEQTAAHSLSLVVLPQAGAQTYYVSTTGLDTNPGTMSKPWATLQHAQSVVQGLSKSKPITVNVRAGTYFLPAGLSFGVDDSGGSSAAPVVWEAFPGEDVVLNGGTRITHWTNAGGGLWTASLPASTLPFENLFYNGQRRLRPRIGASAALDGGTIGTFLRIAENVYEAAPSDNCPDSGFEPDAGYRCYDRFHFDAGDGLTSGWQNLNPAPSNLCGQSAKTGAPPGDIEVDMFEAWSMQKLRISCIDDANSIVYFTAPGPLYTKNFPYLGPAPGHRYLVENVKDLFEQPGQWFLDRPSTGSWTLSYLSNPGENPTTDVVVVPQAQPILELAGAQWLVFRGLTVEMDNYVPGSSGYNTDDNGETNLPGAISCDGCQNVVMDGLTVRRTSANGVRIITDGGGPAPTAVTVENGAFYDLGSSGVQIGLAARGSDTDATLPKNVVVQNNLIQGFSRVFVDGEGIATGALQDSQFIHNDINDGYHTGISVCNAICETGRGSRGTANVATFFNRIWNIFQGLTADGGSIYYGIGGLVRTALDGLISQNVIHDVTDSSIIDKGVKGSGYGGHGVYLDSNTGDVSVQGNVVYRVSASAMHLSQGAALGQPPNWLRNNVFAYGRQSTFEQQRPWPQGCPSSPSMRVSLWNNIFYFDRSDTSSPTFYATQGCAYACGFPYNQFQDFEGNDYWRVDGTYGQDGKPFHVMKSAPGDPSQCDVNNPNEWAFMPLAQWQSSVTEHGQVLQMDEDTTGAIVDPRFANATYPNDDYTLSLAPVPGFDISTTNATVQLAGRSSTTLTAPLVPPTFPTYQFDPATQF